MPIRGKRTAFKLMRVRRDGSLGPLFINRSQRIPLGWPIEAEAHRTKGFTFRPGWHCCSRPYAPHLSERGRRWYAIEIENWEEHVRPKAQGGLWFTAQVMRVVAPVASARPVTPSERLIKKLDRALQPHGLYVVGNLSWPRGGAKQEDCCRWTGAVARRGSATPIKSIASWNTITACLRGFTLEMLDRKSEAHIMVSAL
jgi:hypothetical protein